MAEALLDKVLGKLAKEDEKAYEVLETYKGTDLEYKEYEPLWECTKEAAAKQKKKAHFVVCDNYEMCIRDRSKDVWQELKKATV